jgi:GABA(A) receptor-associated protein
MTTFKQEKTLAERKKDCDKAKKRYPSRIPVICEKHCDSNLPEIDKKKYLVPKDMTVSTFIYVLRKRIDKLDKQQAIYLFAGNTLPQVSKNMADIYQEHADEDGFLYMTYSAESTFGSKEQEQEQEQEQE